jgi:hypothetical protein
MYFSQVKSPEVNHIHSIVVDPNHVDDQSRSGIRDSRTIIPKGHSTGHSHVLQTKSRIRDFLTILALSCHAIFEGLAVGLEKDLNAVWTLFAGEKDFRQTCALRLFH